MIIGRMKGALGEHTPSPKMNNATINEDATFPNKSSALSYPRNVLLSLVYSLYLSLCRRARPTCRWKGDIGSIACIPIHSSSVQEILVLSGAYSNKVILSFNQSFGFNPNVIPYVKEATSVEMHRCAKWVAISNGSCIKGNTRARNQDCGRLDVSFLGDW